MRTAACAAVPCDWPEGGLGSTVGRPEGSAFRRVRDGAVESQRLRRPTPRPPSATRRGTIQLVAPVRVGVTAHVAQAAAVCLALDQKKQEGKQEGYQEGFQAADQKYQPLLAQATVQMRSLNVRILTASLEQEQRLRNLSAASERDIAAAQPGPPVAPQPQLAQPAAPATAPAPAPPPAPPRPTDRERTDQLRSRLMGATVPVPKPPPPPPAAPPPPPAAIAPRPLRRPAPHRGRTPPRHSPHRPNRHLPPPPAPPLTRVSTSGSRVTVADDDDWRRRTVRRSRRLCGRRRRRRRRRRSRGRGRSQAEARA